MKRLIHVCLLFLALITLFSAFNPSIEIYANNQNENKYYMGSAVNSGKDTGYSEKNKITEKDPHFGWTLGKFYVDGYTRQTADSKGNPVFLKTVGDTVTLWFKLEQNISKLNGDDMLSICGDINGFDQYFGIEKTDFGKGTLIIRHTDYQNNTRKPVIYTNYLSSNAKKGASVEVKLCEEGDYEVALNYEIRQDNLDIFGWNPFPTYYNYRIFFKFSVRNGNCMVYPFDVTTGAELTNSSITENGFYLDLAKSRYLNIDIKKEIRQEGANGLTEDVRFNKPARDGEQYTDEGIYTITVSNLYTNQTTTKVIYVGVDDVLKAHVTTGLSISEIEYQISKGAKVSADGTLIPPDPPANQPPTTTEQSNSTSTPNSVVNTNNKNPLGIWRWALISGCFVITIAIGVIFTIIRKKSPQQENTYSAYNRGVRR